ncbi:hypothetical protein [Porphyromonas gulae]|uniref:hypothetical protein n=1 Tax=Porphyromonas gulae TaxID=111105 RepID=UPI0026F20864|nr:hypothetical protein [Porphyromonas gulae]
MDLIIGANPKKPSRCSRIEKPTLPSFKFCIEDERQSPSPRSLSKGLPISKEEGNCILSQRTTDPSLCHSIKLKRHSKYPYFARPYISTDKSHIEHLNTLIQQYIPKGSSFIHIATKQLSNITEQTELQSKKEK